MENHDKVDMDEETGCKTDRVCCGCGNHYAE